MAALALCCDWEQESQFMRLPGGKTTLVQSLSGHPVKSPPWTVGCSVEIIVHPFRAGTQQERPFFIELWDVGGSRSHRNARRVFYPGASGLILVHDLSNRKSEEALESWAAEASGGGGSLEAVVSSPLDRLASPPPSERVPMLLVGSRSGAASATSPELRRIVSSWGAEQLAMDARAPVAPGSTNGLKIAKFLDRVVASYCRKTPGLGAIGAETDHAASSLYDRSHRRFH